MITSKAKEETKYGFHIIPQSYCKVIQTQLSEELLLKPGIYYDLPWNREDVIIIDEESPNITGVYERIQPDIIDRTEMLNWLQIAEYAFKFWDNEKDDVWNNL